MLTKEEFLLKLEKARNAIQFADAIQSELLDGKDLCEVPFSGTNTENLEEAIQCYIQYGELPLLIIYWAGRKIRRQAVSRLFTYMNLIQFVDVRSGKEGMKKQCENGNC